MAFSRQLSVDHLQIGDMIEVDRDDDEWLIVAIRNHERYPAINKRIVTFENGKEIGYCYGKSIRGIPRHS